MARKKTEVRLKLEALNPGESLACPKAKAKSLPSMCKRLWGNRAWTMQTRAEDILITRKAV